MTPAFTFLNEESFLPVAVSTCDNLVLDNDYNTLENTVKTLSTNSTSTQTLSPKRSNKALIKHIVKSRFKVRILQREANRALKKSLKKTTKFEKLLEFHETNNRESPKNVSAIQSKPEKEINTHLDSAVNLDFEETNSLSQQQLAQNRNPENKIDLSHLNDHSLLFYNPWKYENDVLATLVNPTAKIECEKVQVKRNKSINDIPILLFGGIFMTLWLTCIFAMLPFEILSMFFENSRNVPDGIQLNTVTDIISNELFENDTDLFLTRRRVVPITIDVNTFKDIIQHELFERDDMDNDFELPESKREICRDSKVINEEPSFKVDALEDLDVGKQ